MPSQLQPDNWRRWNPREIRLSQVEILPDGKELLTTLVVDRSQSMEGVLESVKNFLRALTYPIELCDTLVMYNEEDEVIIYRSELEELQDKARKLEKEVDLGREEL